MSIGANKYMHHAVLKAVGCEIPKSVIIKPGCKPIAAKEGLNFPLIYKPNSGGFG